VIILIMMVLLTFGISLASRSTDEVALSQQEEESNRVFNAAEAGIEKALSTDLSFVGNELRPTPTLIPNTNAVVDYAITKNQRLQTRLLEGTTAMVKLKDATTALPATVNIDWSRDSDCSAATKPASLIVSVYSISGGITAVRHLPFGACNRNDDIAIAGNGSSGYFRRAVVSTQASDDYMRIKAVYNDTDVLVAASSNLPVQAYQIRSEAKSQAGNETRTIQVVRTLPVSPSIFDYVVYSGTTLTK